MSTATKTRVYLVEPIKAAATDAPRLVRAATPAQAVRHVVRSTLTVRVATQDDIIEAMSGGVNVETCSIEDDEEPADGE